MAENKESPNAEIDVRRRILGFFLFPVALFPLLALLTYDWREVPALCIPPLRPTSNLIGIAGDWFAYTGYRLLGLAVWVLPALCILLGLMLIAGRAFHARRRLLGLALFTFALTCLIQLTGPAPFVQARLHALNIEPNAGGAVGYLVMTLGLTRILSPFGSGVLMASIMLFALLWTIGFGTLVRGAGQLFNWCLDRQDLTPEERAARQRADEEKAAAVRTAKLARAAAKAEQQAEKQRIAAEKQAEKERLAAEKQAKKERLAAEKQAEKQAEKERLEADRLERLRRAAELARVEATAARQPPPAPEPAPAGDASGEDAAVPAADDAAPAATAPYVLPPLSLLNPPADSTAEHGDVELTAQKLISTLDQFGVPASLAFTMPGPVVTQYALALAPGIKPERVASLSNTLQMALEAKSLRIQAPIPGKNAVGIEVPNIKPSGVNFGDIARDRVWQEATANMHVPLLLGKDAAGNILVSDLATLPHLLIAGATGQGKSVCLNSIINGLLMSRTPEDLRLIMVDPKRVEFTQYATLPHLLVPVVNDTNKVVYALKWVLVEMDRRLKVFSRVNCRNIVDFNKRRKTVQPDLFGGTSATSEVDGIPAKFPYIVVIIDEVADIIQTARREVEPSIARLTALARATGIHLILATQRPDAKIITGVIKSNIPGRIAFKTSSSIDARTILDDIGAEDLIGRGDMLYKTKEGILLRAQGAWIQDEEIARITSFIGEHASVQFDKTFAAKLAKVKEANLEDELESDADDDTAEASGAGTGAAPRPSAGLDVENDDDIYHRALEVVRLTGRASTSHFQRRMRIGYNHAARLIDLLEERGIIGPQRGAGPREILIDLNSPPPDTLAPETPAGETPDLQSPQEELP